MRRTALTLLACWPLPSFAMAAEPLAFDQIAGLSVPTAVALSPEGERVAYELAVPEGEWWRVELWVAEVDGSGRRRLASGGSPAWSQDGRWLAYAARDDVGRQVWIVDADGANPRRLTEAAGGVLEWAWSPDARALAYVAPDPATLEALQGPRLYAEGGRRQALFVIPAAGGVALQLTHERSVHASPFGGGGSFAWSPDGGHLAFALQSGTGIEAAYDADLYRVPARGGAVQALVERPGLDVRPVWSPDGRRIAFATSFGARDRFATHGLAVVPVSGGVIDEVGRAIEAAFLDAPQRHVWTPEGDALLVEVARGLSRGLARLDATSGEVTLSTDGERFRTGFSISADGQRVAFLRSSLTEPFDVWSADRVSGEERRITDLNPAAGGWNLPHWETVTWRNAVGDALEGLLARPHQAARDLPLVVWLHGGPEGQVVRAFDPTVPLALPAFDPHPLQLLAARGYAVFLPAVRGGTGYGAAQRLAVKGRAGEALAEDVLPGIDALISRGVVAPDRLAVAGWASGGTRVAELISRSDRFRAATAGAGNYDLHAAYGEGDFAVQWSSLMGGGPWKAREAWDRTSPVRHADRVRTPTLLLHGEADPVVPAAQAIAYHHALRENGVPVELWLYPDEGHGISGRSHREHAVELILGWLERWLGEP